jgi:probable F420-dependent oxidoreductase
MNLGIYVRNMGPASSAQIIARAAEIAEAAGLHSIWVVDHIAIAPENSSGSEGRYLDPLATLAYLAGKTERIAIGCAVLVVPYRPALATAKWIATIQELSGGRLLLGVGVGWMREEFAATGADRHTRGRVTDETLALWRQWFERDEAEANGVRFLFKPRPPRPPFFVGGAAPHALQRCVRFGEGWIPMGGEPAQLSKQIAELQVLADRAAKPRPTVMPVVTLPSNDVVRATQVTNDLSAAGCGGLIHACRYTEVGEFEREVEMLAEVGRRL